MKFSEFTEDSVAELPEPGTEFETKEFKIPVENLPALHAKIKELNKKATKLGTAPNILVMGEVISELIPKRDAEDPPRYRDYQLLTVKGEIPILPGGWSFVGKLEPHEAGVIVKSVPGQQIPERYRHKHGDECEHCNRRRRRVESFIVKKDDEYKQVGRACLKDFLGHNSPEYYANYAEMLSDLTASMMGFENENQGGPRYVEKYDIVTAMTVAMAAIKRDGFVSSQSYSGSPTKITMRLHFCPPFGEARKYFVPLVISAEDEQRAIESIAWIKEQARLKPAEEFWDNLGKLVSVQTTEIKYFGYLAAGAGQYKKQIDGEQERVSVKDGIKNEPLGIEGTKVKYSATIISAFKYQRQAYHYQDSGVSQVITLKTESGHLVKMFTSNLSIKKGDTIEISGKIGKSEVESFEKSPFKGLTVTMMQPRSRIAAAAPAPPPINSSDPFSGIQTISGVNPADKNVKTIGILLNTSDQWNLSLEITLNDGASFIKTVSRDEVIFKT